MGTCEVLLVYTGIHTQNYHEFVDDETGLLMHVLMAWRNEIRYNSRGGGDSYVKMSKGTC